MASGDLFRAFTVRFSFKKEQHVRMLQKFEDRKLNDGKTKNQVVMDALEMYYNSLENDSATKKDKVITEQLLEQRLMKFRQSLGKKCYGNFSIFLSVTGWQDSRSWYLLSMGNRRWKM